MQGTRIHAQSGDDLLLKPGEYGKDPRDDRWYAVTPNGLFGCLDAHEVTEHDNGTITVSPSILVTGYSYEEKKDISWHGYLEQGVWREC